MQRKSPIKVKLQAGQLMSGGEHGYLVTSITGAITLGAFNGQIIRAGDAIDEKLAVRLTESYQVTVTHK
jgi:hypothetical protein